jgi:predicted transcriptional regulator
MSTTTIRLPDDLKSRVANAAERAGTTAHSFILEAIAEKIDQDERRSDFHDLAEMRYATIVASGKTIPWDQMRRYLEDRVAGKKVARPVARKLAR